MKLRLMALLLAVLIVSMMTFAGYTGYATYFLNSTGDMATGVNSHASGNAFQPSNSDVKTVLFGLPLDDRIIALDLNADGLLNKFSYVSRARDQVYQNDNRNIILKFIKGIPGSTLYDISNASGINIGTVRYHLMILALNRLVTAYNDGPRRVRYFTNNGSYSENSMKAISLLKREPTNRLLSALATNTGLTNSGISALSGLSYSDINRYLKELTAKGVVIKVPAGKEKYSYRIAPEMEEYIPGSNLKKDSSPI